MKNFYTKYELEFIDSIYDEIRDLKRERNAVILAHNYMTPDIYDIGDFKGDSLQLAREAANVDAEVIVQAGVYFMAETSKILAPNKTVLIPDTEAGCSLASSITGADVKLIREKYPNYPIVTYVNSSADVKAESDICCTSSNAVAIVEHIAKEWNTDTVIVIPDKYLAQNIANMTNLRIITWNGRCIVHEEFTAKDVEELRYSFPGIIILAHPECPPEVLEKVDFAGSTSYLSQFVKDTQPDKVVLLTECSMSDNVSSENPNVEFIRPCNLCPFMKKITLIGVRDSLLHMRNVVEVEESVRLRAKESIDKMLSIDVKADAYKTGLKPKLIEFV